MLPRHACTPRHTKSVPTTSPRKQCCPRHASTTYMCPRHTIPAPRHPPENPCCQRHTPTTYMYPTTHSHDMLMVSTTCFVAHDMVSTPRHTISAPTTGLKLHDMLPRHVSCVHDMLPHDVPPRHVYPRHPSTTVYFDFLCSPRRTSTTTPISWRYIVGKI